MIFDHPYNAESGAVALPVGAQVLAKGVGRDRSKERGASRGAQSIAHVFVQEVVRDVSLAAVLQGR